MPELPEVETIKNQLEKKIKGKRLEGKTVLGVRRRGKFLIIDFNNKESLVFHLKLTGQILLNAEPSKYTRKVFIFNDKTKLIFNDLRKFGWFKLMAPQGIKRIEEKLGPEPLEISQKDFLARAKARPKMKIKPLLMDQSFIAGIGNIYAAEILFAASVRPDRLAKDLQEKELRDIFRAMQSILKKAIKSGGSSTKDYVDAVGEKGGYAKHHKVYQKEKCLACGSKIGKIKLAGRSSYFCPKCQK